MTSDYKASGLKKRDAKHTKEEPARKPPSRRSGRKKWCRGKVDVPHKPKCFDYGTTTAPNGAAMYKGWKVLRCTECGKKLDFWFPWKLMPEPKPDWVV